MSRRWGTRVSDCNSTQALLGDGTSPQPQVQVFNSSGTWLVPADTTSVQVECYGGGGGGGASAGDGGGGGAYSKKDLAVTPGQILTVTVGAGGNGSTSPPIAGGVGGDSWFKSTSDVLAKGGAGAAVTPPGGPGIGGAAASGVGTTKFSGGNGAQDGPAIGGGGGGGAGSTGAGGNASGGTGGTGTAVGGGNGGNGGVASSGAAGSVNGGGGGGGFGPGTIGGAGARGQIKLTWTPVGAPPGPTVFLGCGDNVEDAQGLRIFAYSDVASAVDGLVGEWALDPAGPWVPFDKYTVLAGLLRPVTLPVRAPFFRLRYTNGATAQSVFQLQTTLMPEADMPTLATGVPTTVRVYESWSAFSEALDDPTSLAPSQTVFRLGEAARNHYVTGFSWGVTGTFGSLQGQGQKWTIIETPNDLSSSRILFAGAAELGETITFPSPIKVRTGFQVRLTVIFAPTSPINPLSTGARSALLGYTLPDTQQLG